MVTQIKRRVEPTKIGKSSNAFLEDEKQRNKLGDYFTLQRGTTYKSSLLGHPGPVLLGLATIQRNGGFRSDSLQTYGGESPEKLLVQPGEIYVSLKDVTQSADLLGAVARLPRGHLAGRLTQDTVKLEPKSDDVPLDYLYWLLRTPQYRAYCRAHSTGTTNLGLSRDDFLAFPVPQPTSEQLLLVETIGHLEAKIDVNLQMNKTLGAIGRTIFKRWFIDFEFPNDEGQPYRSSGGEMDYNQELGKEIPRGWNVGKVGGLATQVKEQVSPSADVGEIYCHFSVEAYDESMIPIPQPGSEIRSNKFKVHDKTILISKLNPRIQRVWPVISSPRNGICSTEFLVFRPRENVFCYFYHLMLSAHVWKELIPRARGTSSSHQRISADDILEFPVVIPLQRALDLFEYSVFPSLAKREQNLASQSTLKQIIDSLLPKLVSGRIRAPVEVR